LGQGLREWLARRSIVVVGRGRSRDDRLLFLLLLDGLIIPRRPNERARWYLLFASSLIRFFLRFFVFAFRGRGTRRGSVVRQGLRFA
jgi:hypothetical protein